MRIATYNVNSINARLPVLLRWLAVSNPDVVCLQELKAPDEKFPIDAIREAGYEAIWHGQKSYNGVANTADYQLGTSGPFVSPRIAVSALADTQSAVLVGIGL